MLNWMIYKDGHNAFYCEKKLKRGFVLSVWYSHCCQTPLLPSWNVELTYMYIYLFIFYLRISRTNISLCFRLTKASKWTTCSVARCLVCAAIQCRATMGDWLIVAWKYSSSWRSVRVTTSGTCYRNVVFVPFFSFWLQSRWHKQRLVANLL